MKITLIHGDNTIDSRKRLTIIIDSIKKRGWDIKTLQESDLKSAASLVATSNSLFSENNLFVIEKFNKIAPLELEKINKISDTVTSNILFWQDGLAQAKLIKLLPKNINIEKFDLPKTVFKLLDSFYPGNANFILQELEKLSLSEPIELFFALLVRQLRDLYWAKVSPETMSIPTWRLGKLKSQANKFEGDKLKNIINELADADIKAKTSVIPLKTSLDLIILKELK